MNTQNQHITQLLMQFEQKCRQKRTQIMQSNDIREIARIVDSANPPSMIAFMKNQMRERKQLMVAAEHRAKDIAQKITDKQQDTPAEGIHSLYRACCGRFPAAAQVLSKALMRRAPESNDDEATPSKTASPGMN